MIIQALIVVLIVAADRFSKLWMTDFLSAHNGYFELWPKVFNLKYLENTGAAFGMLKDARWFFIAVTVLAVIAAIVYSVKERRGMGWLLKISIAMIVGGAIGNLIDRIISGIVVDFFYFELINFAVFNVADSFVTIGAILLAIDILFFFDNREKKKKLKDV